MAFAEWLIYKPSLEEELRIETTARCILEDDNHEEVARLCSTLVKQNFYQEKILKQTIEHVTELEAIIACFDIEEPRKTWWKRLGERWGLTGC